MADLTEIQSTSITKLIGSDSTGAEQTPVQSTASGGLHINLRDLLGAEVLPALEATQVTASVRVGAVLETAPASDTASSGLNGRLQRIAQRLTSLIDSTIDRTQKTQITNGTIDAALTSLAPPLGSNALVVRPIPYEPQSYSAAASGFASASAATDIFTITGSATRAIRISTIRFSATTTSGSPTRFSLSLVKRSTANAGGTRVTTTVVANDSTNSAGTATVGHYTANPTLGTAVGNVRAVTTSVQNTGLNGGVLLFNLSDSGFQPIVLRGVNEQLSINLNGASITGPAVSASFQWTEV